MMSLALVAGAAGFIGLHLINALPGSGTMHLAAWPGVRLPHRTRGEFRTELCGARQNGTWWSA